MKESKSADEREVDLHVTAEELRRPRSRGVEAFFEYSVYAVHYIYLGILSPVREPAAHLLQHCPSSPMTELDMLCCSQGRSGNNSSRELRIACLNVGIVNYEYI